MSTVFRRFRDVNICAECATHYTTPGRRMCEKCLREFVAGINRRHAAELRLPSLVGAVRHG